MGKSLNFVKERIIKQLDNKKAAQMYIDKLQSIVDQMGE